MTTTIVLLSVDESAMLAYSLPAATLQPGAEVLVVDNASGDSTAALAEQHEARYLRLHERLSYAAAMNRALAAVQSEYVLLLNADCFLEPDFLEHAVPRLREDGVGSVAPLLLRTDGPADPGGAVDAAGMFVDRRRKNGLVGHGRPPAAYARPGEAFGADGACALYRRDVLERCALGDGEIFDEDMGLWASDADLAWRARLFGWRCVFEPRAKARHVRTYSPSKRAQVAETHRRLQFRNRYLMWVKNETRSGLARDLAPILAYELAALGYAVLSERHLLGGYRDALAALPGARRRRREIQSRRVVRRVPYGLEPPADA